MTLPDLTTPEGRRAYAFFAILGGCMVTTGHLFGLTYLLRDHPEHLIMLAYGAYVILIISHTALGWAMGRRLQLQGGTDGVTINDSTVDVRTGEG